MANFSEDEFQKLLKRIPTNKKDVNRPKAYSILIDGEIFTTSRGKSVWKQRNHAACAFNNEMFRKVQDSVRLRLQEQGIDRYSVYRFPEYQTSWEDFKNLLIEKNLFKVIELQ